VTSETVTPRFTREEKRKALEREIALRVNVYPQRIRAGKMKPELAEREILIMRAIRDDYAGQQSEHSPERPTGDGHQ
jgi:hypothetical protein